MLGIVTKTINEATDEETMTARIFPMDADKLLKESDILPFDQEAAFKMACGNLTSTQKEFDIMREFIRRYEAAKQHG